MTEIEPLHTQIQKTIQTLVGSVVLEDPKGFPRDESNLYCLGQNNEIVWQAEKPDSEGLFNRVMLNTDGSTLSAYTVTDQSCEIDLPSGKLISYTSLV